MHCVKHSIDYDCDADCPCCTLEARITELEAELALERHQLSLERDLGALRACNFFANWVLQEKKLLLNPPTVSAIRKAMNPETEGKA